MPSVIIFGGYGVFGSQIARELVSRGISVTIAGLNEAKAKALAETMGAESRAADASDRLSCLAALSGHSIAVHCAGPFSDKDTALFESCLERGCHYVDIADSRPYVARLRSVHGQFLQKGLSAVYGASSLPGISGALALRMTRENKEPPRTIRVILFIGHRNPKGRAALESVFRLFGKWVEAPQGRLKGMGDREWVDLPAPFGRKAAFNFESPEYDLFPERLKARSVVVKVAFEKAGFVFSFLGRLPQGLLRLFKNPLLKVGNRGDQRGSSGGAVRVEFSFEDGSKRCTTLLAREKGQQMAVLPAVLAVQGLLQSKNRPGVHAVYEFLGESALLAELEGQGFSIQSEVF